MLRKALALGLLLAMTPSLSVAQDFDIRARGERACKGDAARLCRDVLPGGDMAVLACFQRNRARLSSPCRKFLVEVGQLN